MSVRREAFFTAAYPKLVPEVIPAGGLALQLARELLPRRALFDPITQQQESLPTLVRRCPRDVFEIVHRRGADGARYFPGAVPHRE